MRVSFEFVQRSHRASPKMSRRPGPEERIIIYNKIPPTAHVQFTSAKTRGHAPLSDLAEDFGILRNFLLVVSTNYC